MAVVSVIVPMYKVEKYIERCLDSLINQTFQDIEIICVDDGSPDKSGEIAEQYAARDPRVLVIHKKNAGLGMARNTGLEYAKGKFVMFVDSDDFLSFNLVEELVDAAVKNQADTVIAGYSRYKNGESRSIPNSLADRIFREEEIVTDILSKMIGPKRDGTDTINMAVWRVLFSLDVIKKNELCFPSEREFISEDIIFDLRYYMLCSCVCGVKNTGYQYCLNEGSLTEKYNPNRFEMGKKLFFEKKRILEEQSIYENVKERTEESFMHYSRYSIKGEVKHAKSTGKKETIHNIDRIVHDSELRELVLNRDGGYRNILDRIIDLGISKKNPRIIFYMLTIAYAIRRNKNGE